jgi:hypothetical protein
VGPTYMARHPSNSVNSQKGPRLALSNEDKTSRKNLLFLRKEPA